VISEQIPRQGVLPVFCTGPSGFAVSLQHFGRGAHYINRRYAKLAGRTIWTRAVNVDRGRYTCNGGPPGSNRETVTGANAFFRQVGQLKRVIAGMGLRRSDAEDILQDVFIKAFESPELGRDPRQARRWLMRVTVNRCVLEYRRRGRRQHAVSEIHRRRSTTVSAAIRPDDVVAGEEDIEAIRDALQELDVSLIAPLVLRYFCDLNSTQVGEILDLSPSTVRARLRKGRVILAKRLTEKGLQP